MSSQSGGAAMLPIPPFKPRKRLPARPRLRARLEPVLTPRITGDHGQSLHRSLPDSAPAKPEAGADVAFAIIAESPPY